MAQEPVGEAGTSPDRVILIQHVETPEFTPPALVRQGWDATDRGVTRRWGDAMNANILIPISIRQSFERVWRLSIAMRPSVLVGVERPGYLQLVRIHPVDGKAISTSFVIGT